MRVSTALNRSSEACLPPLSELVKGHRSAFIVESHQRSLDLIPDTSDSDTEDPLAALKEVIDLIRAAALVDRSSIAHQGDR